MWTARVYGQGIAVLKRSSGMDEAAKVGHKLAHEIQKALTFILPSFHRQKRHSCFSSSTSNVRVKVSGAHVETQI